MGEKMKEKLAIEGGIPVRSEPFPSRIMFDKEERKAVLKLIEKASCEDTALTLDRYGVADTEVDLYEKDFAAYFGVKYATAVSSGTAALHSALGSLRLEPGDEVITTPIADPGTIAPILFQNCIPVFADEEYETLNIDPRSIEERITERTKVIIPVHLAGLVADMDPIMEIAKKHNLIVIEDCAQAHGAKYKGRYTGTIGDMGIFSLMSLKHMTSAGQGGMLITNNEEFYWNAKRFADRGKPFNSVEKSNLFLGLNYRMTQLQAVIGRVQLKKLAAVIKKRQGILKSLKQGMKELIAVKLWKIIEDTEPNPWFFFLHYDKNKMKVDKETFAKTLQAEGIPVRVDYGKPMYPMHKAIWIREKKSYGNSSCPWACRWGRDIDYTHHCPMAEKALDDHMVLWMHECWTEREIEDTIKALKKVEKTYMK